MANPPKACLVCSSPLHHSFSHLWHRLLGSRVVFPGAHWQGKVVLGAKAVLAGPESEVSLEREMLLKQLSSWWGGCDVWSSCVHCLPSSVCTALAQRIPEISLVYDDAWNPWENMSSSFGHRGSCPVCSHRALEEEVQVNTGHKHALKYLSLSLTGSWLSYGTRPSFSKLTLQLPNSSV